MHTRYQPTPDLFVVIVSWNTAHLLRGCLASLAAATLAHRLDVIVVDNASSDDSAAMVARDFPWVRLLRNTANVGFARASNQGIRHSQGAYLLLLNSDTYVPPAALEHLLAFLQSQPQAGACGPRLLQPGGQPQPYAFGGDPTPAYLLRRGLWRLLLGRALHDWQTSQVQAVDWVSGACLLLRRAALEQAGLLDERMFLYFEDNDLCLRLRQHGWQVFYYPHTAVVHAGGRSLARNPAARRAYDHSLIAFYCKHYSPLAGLWLRGALALYRLFARV